MANVPTTRTAKRKPSQTAKRKARAKPAIKRSPAKRSKPAAKPTTRKASTNGFAKGAKITLTHKGNPHRSTRSKRGQKWACLRTGMTVEAAVKKMEAKNLRVPRNYLRYAQASGFLTVR